MICYLTKVNALWVGIGNHLRASILDNFQYEGTLTLGICTQGVNNIQSLNIEHEGTLVVWEYTWLRGNIGTFKVCITLS